MQKPEQTLTIRQRYEQLLSTGFRFDLVAPSDPIVESTEVERRHDIICRKIKTYWPIENLRKAVNDGRIRLGLFRKSGKIIGIGYYSETTDICTLEKGIFVYGLQLDPAAKALPLAEAAFNELVREFGYTSLGFASPRKAFFALAHGDWSLQYSVFGRTYGR